MSNRWYKIKKTDGTEECMQGKDKNAMAKLYGVPVADVEKIKYKDVWNKFMKGKVHE